MTDSPTAVLFAYSEVGASCLASLLSIGARIGAVFTHEDDPNENIWFRSVAGMARAARIPVFTCPAKSAEARVAVEAVSPDIIYSFYYRKLISDEVLQTARLGAYNMHGSLLPRYRGRAPVNWAVINGETETGVTLHVMTDEPDRGPIVGSERIPIAFEENAHDIFLKVAAAGARVIARCHPAIASGRVLLTEQDESQASYFGRRTPADGEIDWSRSAVEIYNLVRGTTRPFPGAFTMRDGKKITIWRARPLETPPASLPPGQFAVACGEGTLLVEEYEIENPKER